MSAGFNNLPQERCSLLKRIGRHLKCLNRFINKVLSEDCVKINGKTFRKGTLKSELDKLEKKLDSHPCGPEDISVATALGNELRRMAQAYTPDAECISKVNEYRKESMKRQPQDSGNIGPDIVQTDGTRTEELAEAKQMVKNPTLREMKVLRKRVERLLQHLASMKLNERKEAKRAILEIGLPCVSVLVLFLEETDVPTAARKDCLDLIWKIWENSMADEGLRQKAIELYSREIIQSLKEIHSHELDGEAVGIAKRIEEEKAKIFKQ